MGRTLDAINEVILGQNEAAANAATSFGEDATALLPQKFTLTGTEGSQSIIDADPGSLGIVIGVPSAQDKNVFLAFGSAAVMQAGISLVAGEHLYCKNTCILRPAQIAPEDWTTLTEERLRHGALCDSCLEDLRDFFTSAASEQS